MKFFNMFKKLSIGSKITFLVFTVVFITVIAISFTAYNLINNSIADRYLENLSAITQLKKSKVSEYLQNKQENVILAKKLIFTEEGLLLLGSDEEDVNESLVILNEKINTQIQGLIQQNIFGNVTILNNSGEVLFTTQTNQLVGSMFNSPDENIVGASREGISFSSIYQSNDEDRLIIGMPLSNDMPNTGIILAEINLMPIYEIVQDSTSLGNTGETLLTMENNKRVVFLNPLRHTDFKKSIVLGDSLDNPFQEAAQGNAGAFTTTDYRDAEVLAVWDYIPVVKWGIITKIDTQEIYQKSNTLIINFTIAGGVIILLSLMISIVFSRFLAEPLATLKSTLMLLRQGILPSEVKKFSNDEIGQMADITGQLVQSLKRTAQFAHDIGEGDFSTDFQPLSKDDALGNALVNMRESIQEAEKRDNERNWIVTGVAEIGAILREHNKLQELGDAVAAYVTNKINAVQGAFYVVNDDEKDNIFIEMVSSYAYNKKKHLKAEFKFAEGLVGQSAIEQDTLLRTEIPYDYVTITSGLLGDRRPECLLVVPLITDEKVFGVLEFAGFDKFSSREVKFVEEISVITARTIFNIKVNERTRKLLEESQQMSNELQEQQEVLRQNAEEMQATQEELKRTNFQLEEQVAEVERTQNRMASLLENASEVVTIYEKNGQIRYISPSVERILGYSQDEMIGQKDINYIQGEGIEVFDNMFRTLLNNPDESVTVQYIYQIKNGGEIWIEATGTNLLDDPAVQGIILNSRDITERRRAEQEERMRSKMQALSENSPDLITRLDQEGTTFYINPVIETYTGFKPDHFLMKDIKEAGIESAIVQEWMNILGEVKEQNDKVDREIHFPSVMGDRVMQVNAIPEFDEEEKLESVLVVSHDITDRKLIELEIQTKNKKITESINYAQRIQGAILPSTKIINKVFPESFIFYKAKDVVSGDFPWFLQRGEDIFIAAVDCTGHGVPGALISLIGYFLLNDIVRSRKITEPGEILDLLDEGVTQTLRQDSDDSKTKDGMDIALCRINLKNNQLQYAGAHRPLYHMEKGTMNEIKGDKWPIGGGIYKNQTNFTTTTIQLNKNDSVFFCSDGFPDQFGGPDNRKFGPKRTRELIEQNHAKSMKEIGKALEESWEAWKGEDKQTDDVLMIGIKF